MGGQFKIEILPLDLAGAVDQLVEGATTCWRVKRTVNQAMVMMASRPSPSASASIRTLNSTWYCI